MVEGAGGGERFFEVTNTRALSHFVIIVVDASTTPERHFEGTTDEPSISDTFDAMTDIQLHRYNDATKSLMKQKMPQWAKMASTPELTPKPFFIDINLQSLTDPSKHQQINAIPTDLTLDKESVTMLIEEGRQQLLQNPQFIELVKQLQ